MTGKTIFVEMRNETGVDGFCDAIYEYSYIAVENVLIAPGPRIDVAESNRPEGVLVRYTLYFPKTFDCLLEGLRINVLGEWLKVIGAPRPFGKESCPTSWNMVVEVGVVHG